MKGGVAKVKRKKEDYMPHADFKGYMEKRLHNELEYIKKRDAGALTLEDEKEHVNIIRMQNHWLNKCVFQSMANLTMFLEYVAKSEELQKVFNKYLEELFLGIYIEKKEDKKKRGNNPDPKKPSYDSDVPVFQRFIVAATTVNWNNKDSVNDFRLALISIMANVLFQKLNTIIPIFFNVSLSGSDSIMVDLRNIILNTKMLAKNVKIDIEDPDRPVLF